MINIDKESLIGRFLRYVQIDTQSDPESNTFPTTIKQKNLSNLLLTELQEMGISSSMDEFGYVYASIPSNSLKKTIPGICFCSHVDTAPDCSGTDIKPIVHKNYDGHDIKFTDDENLVLKISDYPYLKNHIGSEIITASGKTLLGADDKSGVAIIMEMAAFIVKNNHIRHGKINIVFTPDEEVGKGTAKINMKKLDSLFGYTLDGGEAGSLEDENFSADGVKIVIHGVIAHPGYAKNKLVNALKIGAQILENLPKQSWSPETTSGREGFVHPISIDGIAEKATLKFILRDFDTIQLKKHGEKLKSLAEDILQKYPTARMQFIITDQYRNMKEILKQNPLVTAFASEAITRAGIVVTTKSIRGGTDGSRLSFMGLPCPNIFTGMQAIHSKLEWIGVKDMIKSTETLIHLIMIWEEKGSNSKNSITF